jgi:hypothetical protein
MGGERASTTRLRENARSVAAVRNCLTVSPGLEASGIVILAVNRERVIGSICSS